MESYALYHFSTMKNGRQYQFTIQPEAPFDDIDLAFLDFMQEFTRLRAAAKASAEAAAAKAKADAEAAAAEAPAPAPTDTAAIPDTQEAAQS